MRYYKNRILEQNYLTEEQYNFVESKTPIINLDKWQQNQKNYFG